MPEPISRRAPLVGQQLERETKINALTKRLHDATDLTRAVQGVYGDLMELLNAERVTIYERSRRSDDLLSRFKVKDELKEIRVPLSTASIAGYCGLANETIVVADVYDEAALKAIHPSLQFNAEYDRATRFRTRSVLAVPIRHQGQLLGVLQVLNCKTPNRVGFDSESVQLAARLAELLGQKFRYEMQATSSPYGYLVMKGRLTQEQLSEVESRAKKERVTTSSLLMSDFRLSPAEIGASLERFYQVPYQAYDVQIKIPRELIKEVKEAYLQAALWVPIDGDRKCVTVLLADPSDASRVREIQGILNAERYIFRVGMPEDVLRFLSRKEPDAQSLTLTTAAEDPHSTAVDEAEVVQLVSRLIREATVARASDVHFEPAKPPHAGTVRFRIDGECAIHERLPAQQMRAIASRIKVLARLDISETRLPQDGKIVVTFKGAEPTELRVATVPTIYGESVTLRILATSKLKPIDELDITNENLERIRAVATQPHGIFLVVGPTGSGKTTTLHAFLHLINSPDRKIWTAEDPVEITQEGLQQVQVNPKIGLTFARALRAFLRADPDVVMIGEMRDSETASIGVEASLTGHLVLSTLHTNSAAETIVRLLDLGVDTASFSDALLGVLSQRLVRRLCEHCRQFYSADKASRQIIEHYTKDKTFRDSDLQLCRSVGCDACNGSGYRGRVGVHELLINTAQMKELIFARAKLQELQACAQSNGMRSLAQDIVTKIRLGLTDMTQLSECLGSAL